MSMRISVSLLWSRLLASGVYIELYWPQWLQSALLEHSWWVHRSNILALDCKENISFFAVGNLPKICPKIVSWRKLISKAQGQGSSRLWRKALDLLLSLPLPHTFFTILPLWGEVWKKHCQCLLKHKSLLFQKRDKKRVDPTVSNNGWFWFGRLIAHLHILVWEPTGDEACANIQGNTSRAQLTQIPNVQKWCQAQTYTFCLSSACFQLWSGYILSIQNTGNEVIISIKCVRCFQEKSVVSICRKMLEKLRQNRY